MWRKNAVNHHETMESTPLISVLMPVYNGEKYIADAIKSVLNQTFRNFELIIINDGSIDNSEKEILSFLDHRIRYITNDVNIGLILTLNKGISLARGKYIARMDADDICIFYRFEEQVSFLEKNPDYSLCGTWAYLIDTTGKNIGRIKNIKDNELLKISLLFTNPIIHPSVMIKTNVLLQYKYDPNALHVEDQDLWLRIAIFSAHKIAIIPKFLLKYRWHETNVSVKNQSLQREHKNNIIKPYIETFLNREITPQELLLHTSSFELYKFSKKEEGNTITLEEEKKWFELLSKRNKEKKHFDVKCFDAFLWSRWVVYCWFVKRLFFIFKINLSWYNPFIFLKTIKLLINK